MGFLDDLMASAKSVVDFAEKKTDNVVELSKLKYQQSQLATELRLLYEKLGSAVYSMVKAEYDNKELIDALADEIDEIKEAIQTTNEKIAQRKAQQLCPACGYSNDKEAIYCMKCGNRLVFVTPKEESCDCGCGCGCDDGACDCGEKSEEACSCGCECGSEEKAEGACECGCDEKTEGACGCGSEEKAEGTCGCGCDEKKDQE